MRANFPYLIPDRDRYGVMRYYVRRHGRKIRIREKPGTEGFHLAYAEAMLALDPTAAEQREVLSTHRRAPLVGWRLVISHPPNFAGSIRSRSESDAPLSRTASANRGSPAPMMSCVTVR